MRIAIFTDTFTPDINGVARTLGRLCEYLLRQSIPFQVYAPQPDDSAQEFEVVSQFDHYGSHFIRSKSFPFLLYPECRLAVPNPVALRRSLQQFQPTILHIATPFNLGLYGLHYGKKHNIPMVASYHTHFDDYLPYYHAQFLQKWLWSYMKWFHHPMKKVYVPSPSTKEKLIQHDIHNQIEIWSRGVDHKQYSPTFYSPELRKQLAPEAENLILYVGRLAPEKEIELAIHSFLALPDDIRSKSQFIVVGEGPLYTELVEKAYPNISFIGFKKGRELAQIYASCDLFFFPSSTETFGNVVLEAMASGIPVIGAEAGGVQHLIQHESNGILCAPQDQDNFTGALQRLLVHTEQRQRYGIHARQYALQHSWDVIFSQLVASYTSVDQAERLTYTA